jgi:hypothetical protein
MDRKKELRQWFSIADSDLAAAEHLFLNTRTTEFDKPASGRIAVKVINHLGDEVMKVFKV